MATNQDCEDGKELHRAVKLLKDLRDLRKKEVFGMMMAEINDLKKSLQEATINEEMLKRQVKELEIENEWLHKLVSMTPDSTQASFVTVSPSSRQVSPIAEQPNRSLEVTLAEMEDLGKQSLAALNNDATPDLPEIDDKNKSEDIFKKTISVKPNALVLISDVAKQIADEMLHSDSVVEVGSFTGPQTRGRTSKINQAYNLRSEKRRRKNPRN